MEEGKLEMQKPSKAGSASATPAKRGRPFGSTTGSGGGGGGASSSASPGDPGSAASIFGPSLHVYSNLVGSSLAFFFSYLTCRY